MTAASKAGTARAGLRLAAVDGVAVGAAPAKAAKARPVKAPSPPPGSTSAPRSTPATPTCGSAGIELRGRGWNDKRLLAALKAVGDRRLLDMLIGLRADLAQFEREAERRRAAGRPAPKPYDGPRLLVLAEEAARFQEGRLLVTEEGVPFRFTGYGRAWPGGVHDAERAGRPELEGQRVCYAYGTAEPSRGTAEP